MSYTLRRSTRARTLRIAVYPDGAVVVTVPPRAALPAIERFIARHEPWIARTRARLRPAQVIRLKRGDIPELKRAALAFAEDRASYYAARYGFRHGKIAIRAQKSRWGSCSRRGNLSFNYKIAALPREIAEYIVIHEICHLGAFDHSKRFWELVEREAPDHKRLRKRLRETAFAFD